MNNLSIKIGDKFKAPDGSIREVIGTKPGGKVELFCKKTAMFTDRWHKDVILWQRLN